MNSLDSMTADYQKLTTDCGYVDLKPWSTVSLTGADRQSFLHNMCTNHINHLSSGEGCEAFCTDVQGKIVAQVFVFARVDRLDLLMAPEQAEKLISHLERYIIREDVLLEDRSNAVSWSVVAGPTAGAALAKLGFQGVADLSDAWQNAEANLAGDDCLVARSSPIWPDSFLLQTSSEQQAAGVRLLENIGVSHCSGEALNAVRIEAKAPLFGIDFTSDNLPQEVDRDEQAISFNKGCYLGQETVARIDALGQVNRKVVRLQFSGKVVPAIGLELFVADKVVGQVTSRCWSPTKECPLALAMVRRSANAEGSQLECELGPARVKCPS